MKTTLTLDLTLPKSWAALSQSQLKSVCKFLASDRITTHQAKLLLAFKFSGIKFLGLHGDEALVKVKKMTLLLDQDDMLAIAHELDYLESDPVFPVRLFELKHRKAVHPLMREISFARWLGIENLYCGFMQTHKVELLNEILSILYPKKGYWPKFIKAFDYKKFCYAHINLIIWLGSFKKYLCRRYPELYKAAGSPDVSRNDLQTHQQLMESMNAQIRALTKGDITKNEAVLEMDLHSALTELDALALESRKLKESLKNHK